MKKIAVMGGGIIGVTTAVALQEAGHQVHIYATDPIETTTSWAAGAISYPFGVEDSPRTDRWFKETDEVLEGMMDDPAAGIFWAYWKKCTYDPDFEIPEYYMRLRNARLLSEDECPLDYKKGLEAKLLQMDVGKYFPYLFQKFLGNGGEHILVNTQKSFDCVENSYDLAVNATGVYARDIVNDEKVYPMRGQIVLIKNPGLSFHFATFEKKYYFYPRYDEIVLGGSMDVGEWDLTPNNDLTEEILGWAKTLDPKLAAPEVIGVRVGLRPMRETVRLEVDESLCQIPVIHNYGHGGAGYTLSWGCAREVVRLVEKL